MGLANDYDAEGDAFYFDFAQFSDWDYMDSYTKTAHGEVVYDGDGSFEYTPDLNFSGIDTLNYQLEDSEYRYSLSSIITFNVMAINDAPFARVQNSQTPVSQLISGVGQLEVSGAIEDGEGLIIYGIDLDTEYFYDQVNDTSFYGNRKVVLTRWLKQGLLDTSFGKNGVIMVPISVLAQNTYNGSSNGELIKLHMVKRPGLGQGWNATLGYSFYDETNEAYQSAIEVIRINSDGSLDMGFADNGRIIHALPGYHAIEESPLKIQMTSDGNMVVVGSPKDLNYYSSIVVLRLASDGSQLPTNGLVTPQVGSDISNYFKDFVIDAANNLYILGDADESFVMKLTDAGILDTGFATTGVQTLTSVSSNYLYPSSLAFLDGAYPKLIVVGSYSASPDGSLLGSLNPSTGAVEILSELANDLMLRRVKVQTDGQLLVTGQKIDSQNGGAYVGQAMTRYQLNLDPSTHVVAEFVVDEGFVPYITLSNYSAPNYASSNVGIFNTEQSFAQLLHYDQNTISWNNLTAQGEPNIWDLTFDVNYGFPSGSVSLQLTGYDAEGDDFTYSLSGAASSTATVTLSSTGLLTYTNNDCYAPETLGDGDFYDVISFTLTDNGGANGGAVSTTQSAAIRLLNCGN